MTVKVVGCWQCRDLLC